MQRFTLLIAVSALAAASLARAEEPPVVRSARSGLWSAGETWEGEKVPSTGVKVQVRPEHVVTYDVRAADDLVVRSLHIAGTLSFAPDKSTQLNVGLLKIEATDSTEEEGFDCDHNVGEVDPNVPRASLLVGTPEQPVAAGQKALIRLVYVEGMQKESCPAIVCCGGRMDFHGAPMNRTWVKLGATAPKGSRNVTLAEEVAGWKVGDKIVVTATQTEYRKELFSEERTIAALEGTKLTLNEPLVNDHSGEGIYRGEVANLSRNVVVESASPDGVRGHTMYHKGSAGSISYAEFRHLGKKDTLGRYSLHFHLCGTSMRGSSVVGASIWDSHNRWLTIHGTNYLVVRDCVGFRSIGHGYFLEDGTEVYNVLDRNLAIEASAGKRLPKQVLPFDGNEGAGFWWANSRNTFTRYVAAACDVYGFRFEATSGSSLKLDLPVMQPDGTRKITDIRTLPFVRFEDNEIHSSRGVYGFNLGEGVNHVGPDARHPFIVRNTNIWDVHYGFRPQVPSLLVENMTIRSSYGVYHPNFDNHLYRNLTIRQTNTEPFNRGHDDDSTQWGVLAVDGLTFEDIRSGGMPLIQISDDNMTGNAVSHFRNVKLVNWNDNSRQKALVNLGGGPRPQPKTEKGVPVYIHDWFGAGKTAMVVSTRSPEYKAHPNDYREEKDLTGDESRASETTNAEFPTPVNPIDDLPPATVITSVRKTGGKLLVSGTCSDNGTVTKVVVSSQTAKGTSPNFATWEIELDATTKTIAAHAEDEAGNVEKLAHEIKVN
jgi:hypothetical protein